MTKNYGKLTFTLPNQRRKEFLLTQNQTTIGRALDNDLVLVWGDVADYHCRIDCSSAGCVIVNLQSDQPLRIDNRVVEKANLIPGNVIQIGHGRLRFSGPVISASEGAATVIRSTNETVALPPIKQPEKSPSAETTIARKSKTTLVSKSSAPSQTQPHEPTDESKQPVRTIGRYEIHEMLGYRGNFVVYRGRDPQLDRVVAIKVLSTQFPADDELRANIRREVELIAGLEHPNIVQVYDFGEHNKQPYVVMPFLDAGTLTARLAAEGPMSLETAATMFESIAAGLDLAHNQGIIHRQLKPNNILFDVQEKTYISDFGISTIATAIERDPSAGSEWALHISPEQARMFLEEPNTVITKATDIYSLGVILFEVLTGQPPFQGETAEEIARAHIEAPIPRLQDINPNFKREYQYVIDQALAKDPAQRHRSVIDFAQHVSETAAGRWYIGQLTNLGEQSKGKKADGQTQPTGENAAEIDVTINLYMPLPDQIQKQPPPIADEETLRKLSGRTIGRYELERPIGRGGMASVYLARDPIMDRQVAVKVLPPKLMENERFRQLFHHEAKLVARLRHKSIVSVFDFGEHHDQPFIVMQYLRGGTLADQLVHGPVTIKALLPIIHSVAEAIDEANKQNIIHRDVKPANIIFNAEGEAFLSDFGIAVISAAASNKEHYAGGTPRYMSPEQALGVMANKPTKLDGRSDIYSLGAVLFHMLTGQVPYPADGSPVSMIRAHITAPIPQVREYMPNLPGAWQEIINQALAKKPEDRFQTATELAEAVAEVSTGRWYLKQLLD